MRIRLLASLFVLLVSACAGDSTVPTTDGDTLDTATTRLPANSGEPGATATTAAAEGPPAPQFSTVLSDGTPFSLQDEMNPIYLVFWAEW